MLKEEVLVKSWILVVAFCLLFLPVASFLGCEPAHPQQKRAESVLNSHNHPTAQNDTAQSGISIHVLRAVSGYVPNMITVNTRQGLTIPAALIISGCGSFGTTPHVAEESPVEKQETLSSSRDYSNLLARARETGTIRIIARLDMKFVPDGQLSARESMEQQGRIAGMQDQLCAALSKYQLKGIKRFQYTPYIAMEVDASALAALIANPLVLSVEEDVPVPKATR